MVPAVGVRSAPGFAPVPATAKVRVGLVLQICNTRMPLSRALLTPLRESRIVLHIER